MSFTKFVDHFFFSPFILRVVAFPHHIQNNAGEVTWNDAEQLNRQQLIRRDWCGNAIIETKHCVLCLIDVVVEQFAKVPNEGAHLNLYTHCAFDGDFRFPFVQFFIELHVFVRREKGGGLMRTI